MNTIWSGHSLEQEITLSSLGEGVLLFDRGFSPKWDTFPYRVHLNRISLPELIKPVDAIHSADPGVDVSDCNYRRWE